MRRFALRTTLTLLPARWSPPSASGAPGRGHDRQVEGRDRRPRPQEGGGAARRRPAGRGVALTLDGLRAYVVSSGGSTAGALSAIDLATRAVVGADRRARRRARASRSSGDGTRAYVTSGGRAGESVGRRPRDRRGRRARSRRRSARPRSRCRPTARAPTWSAARASSRSSTSSALRTVKTLRVGREPVRRRGRHLRRAASYVTNAGGPPVSRRSTRRGARREHDPASAPGGRDRACRRTASAPWSARGGARARRS